MTEGIIQGERVVELFELLPCRSVVNGSETLVASGVFGLEEAGDTVMELDDDDENDGGEEEKFGTKEEIVVADDDDAVLIILDIAENIVLFGIVVVVARTDGAPKLDGVPLLLVNEDEKNKLCFAITGGLELISIEGLELAFMDVSFVFEDGFEPELLPLLLQHWRARK
ncbi:hypothetical protein BGZ76_010185 [Entomortierella beljakovae]|nr:hypothetical protein BGZ76_010185 [Entomortierella beljakovae]